MFLNPDEFSKNLDESRVNPAFRYLFSSPFSISRTKTNPDSLILKSLPNITCQMPNQSKSPYHNPNQLHKATAKDLKLHLGKRHYKI